MSNETGINPEILRLSPQDDSRVILSFLGGKKNEIASFRFPLSRE